MSRAGRPDAAAVAQAQPAEEVEEEAVELLDERALALGEHVGRAVLLAQEAQVA